jgi:hypothetical protein
MDPKHLKICPVIHIDSCSLLLYGPLTTSVRFYILISILGYCSGRLGSNNAAKGRKIDKNKNKNVPSA